MPLIAWRLVKAKYATSAFDGEGARRFGGRWNERGTPMVYLGGSLALAALEVFVHLTVEDARVKFMAIAITIPDALNIAEMPLAELPANWRQEPPPDATKKLGTSWTKLAQTAVLQVPSIIIPNEKNYLVNPLHPDYERLSIGQPQPFGFDTRMWK